MEKPVIDGKMRDKLRAGFPSEAYSQHPTKKYLTTLKAFYVTERLNDVFGIGRWTVESEVVSDHNDYVLMRGRIVVFDYECELPFQYGGHKTSGKNVEPADGYKSAITDLQSKCASYLEIGAEMFKGKIKPGQPVDRTEPVLDNKTQKEIDDLRFDFIKLKEKKKTTEQDKVLLVEAGGDAAKIRAIINMIREREYSTETFIESEIPY